MENYISDAELTRIIKQRVKQAQEELYDGTNKAKKELAYKEAVIYTHEVIEEIISEQVR